MKRTTNTEEKYIWTPLIGFDREKADRGVDEYYSGLGFAPDGISLFVFSPDIVHLHEGMAQERVFPPDHCNYYGNVCNDARAIQEWTNFDLRELVSGLEKRGARTYLGLMGCFTDREPSDPEPYNIGHREWLFDHEELIGVYTQGRYSLNVLKRFKDGTFYEDYFVEKVRGVLNDYGLSGLHAADNFCPPAPAAKCGDFSDDMIAQFCEHTGLNLPAEILAPVAGRDLAGIGRRADYIWTRYRLEWLQFMTWRWAGFWKKVCDGLHQDGKKVMVNNAWCTDPFEAIYRFGIDYKKLFEAGIDYLAAETVPTGAHSVKHDHKAPSERYRLYDFMTMPALIKASNPQGKTICLSGVKDATEEWSTLTFFPSILEREIYTLTNTFLQTSTGLQRAMEGFLVCLGDGLSGDEWTWLRERWALGFGEIPERVLTPTMIWSDSANEKFLPDYIRTKRWSAHKTVYEFTRRGGQCGVFANIADLDSVQGPLFVPNIDLLTESEIEAIAAYKRGPIIASSLTERNFVLPGRQPELYFEDPNANLPMCCLGYDLGAIDFSQITVTLGEDDGSADIEGDPQFATDPDTWRQEMGFRKVSSGFAQACSQLIRVAHPCDLSTDLEYPFLPLQLPDGRIRLMLVNDSREHYSGPMIRSQRIVKKVVSHSKFPAIPSKLLDVNGEIITPRSDRSHESIVAYGFTTKIPPGGMTILDVELADS